MNKSIKSYANIVKQSSAFRQKNEKIDIGKKSEARIGGKLTGKDFKLDKLKPQHWNTSCKDYLKKEFAEMTKKDESEFLNEGKLDNEDEFELIESRLLQQAYESAVDKKSSGNESTTISITTSDVLDEFQYFYTRYCLKSGNDTISQEQFQQLKKTAENCGIKPNDLMKLVQAIHNKNVTLGNIKPIDILLYFLETKENREGKDISEKFSHYTNTLKSFNNSISQEQFQQLNETAQKHEINPLDLMKLVEAIHNENVRVFKNLGKWDINRVDMLLCFLETVEKREGKDISEKFSHYISNLRSNESQQGYCNIINKSFGMKILNEEKSNKPNEYQNIAEWKQKMNQSKEN